MRENILKSKWFWIVAGGIGELILLLLVFRFGMVVGIRKANFNEEWGKNYSHFFGEPHPGFFLSFGGGDNLRSAFGNAGTVLSVGSSTIVIETSGNNEKTIAVDTSTAIRAGMMNVGLGNIQAGDPIVVIGEPNGSGEITARFIRIFPMDTSLPPRGGPVMMYRATGTNQ